VGCPKHQPTPLQNHNISKHQYHPLTSYKIFSTMNLGACSSLLITDLVQGLPYCTKKLKSICSYKHEHHSGQTKQKEAELVAPRTTTARSLRNPKRISTFEVEDYVVVKYEGKFGDSRERFSMNNENLIF
jgi:hypothetical protein